MDYGGQGMKVLYIGNYRDGTGWATAAENYILALDAVGIDVVPRCVRYNNNVVEIPDRISELEAKSDKDCNILIQHLLPHAMEYNGNFEKCIGIYESETTNFNDMGWAARLNCMDELWVPNQQMLNTKRDNHISIPMYCVNHATDINKYSQSYKNLDIPDIEDKFVFYFIGEANRRKNLPALLRAFHLEFSPSESVSLVIKSSLPGQSAETSREHVKGVCEAIKTGLKLYKDLTDYHQEIIISDRLTNEQIFQLHASCDCFVCPSYGEAWAYPAMDAMGMGKPVIGNRSTGVEEYIKHEETGLLVKNSKEAAFAAMDTFPDLYTGNEQWWAINIDDLRLNMRRMYEDKILYSKLSANGIDNIVNFSHYIVGKRMRELLCVS